MLINVTTFPIRKYETVFLNIASSFPGILRVTFVHKIMTNADKQIDCTVGQLSAT